MYCEITLTMKDPQTLEGPSKLNQQLLEVMDDKMPGLETSFKYYEMLRVLPVFMGTPMFVPADHPERENYDKALMRYSRKNMDHAFDPNTGEPVLFADDLGGYFFMNHRSERLYVKEPLISESQRIDLIKALAFQMIDQEANVTPDIYLKQFFEKKIKNLNSEIERINKEREGQDKARKRLLGSQRTVLKDQIKMIESFMSNRMFMLSLAKGINSEIKGAQLQYDQELIKEGLLDEDKDVSMGIERYILSSDEIRDDSTIEPVMFRIMNTVVDFDYNADGTVTNKTESIFGMETAKSSNEVKNRVLDLVNTLYDEFNPENSKGEDAYTVMIELMKEHTDTYNDELTRRFLRNLNDEYEKLKTDSDKTAFKVKFFKSFFKSTNTFILTEVTKEKDGDGNITRLVFKDVDPDSLQNKRAKISQDIVTSMVYKNNMDDKDIDVLLEYLAPNKPIEKSTLVKILDAYGISLNPKTIDLLIDNQKDLTLIGDKHDKKTLISLIRRLTSKTKHRITYDRSKAGVKTDDKNPDAKLDGKVNVYQAVKLLNDPETSDKDVREIKLSLTSDVLNSPIYVLATAEAIVTSSVTDSNYNIAGKSRYKYSNPNGYNRLIKRWQSGDFKTLELLKDRGLPYVDYLLCKDLEELNPTDDQMKAARMRRINQIRLISNAQMREVESGANRAVEHKEIGEGDLLFDQMFKLMNTFSERFDNVSKLKDGSHEAEYWQNLQKTIASINYNADKGSSYGLKGLDEAITKTWQDPDGTILKMFHGEILNVKEHSVILSQLFEIDKEDNEAIHDYISKNLTPGFHYKNKVVTIEPHDSDTHFEITHKYDFETNTTTIIKKHVASTPDYTIPESSNLSEKSEMVGLSLDLIKEGDWRKFGFFNSSLQGNEKAFDFLWEVGKNGVPIITNAFIQIAEQKQEALDNQSLNDIVINSVNDLINDDLNYIKAMDGLNMSKQATSIASSTTDAQIKSFLKISLMNNMQMFQLFSGDLAFYKQRGKLLSMEDALKRGPAPSTDGLQIMPMNGKFIDGKFVKDVKGTYTDINGNQVEYNALDKSIVAVVENLEFDESQFEEQIKAGLASNAHPLYESRYINYGHEIADAGAFMTIDHKMDLIDRIYGLTDEDRRIAARLKDPNEPMTEEDWNWLHKAGNADGATKFVGFEKRPVSVNVGERTIEYEQPVFLKYAPVTIIPKLVKGTSVEHLLNAMEKQGVHQVVFKSGSKASNPPMTSIHLTDTINGVEAFAGINPDLKLNPFEFSLSNLKLQVELPTHFDTENTIGNQHVKNLIANLDLANPAKIYYHKGKKISASEVFELYSKAITDILKHQSQKFLDKYNIEFIDGKINHNNPKLREMLISQMDINEDYTLINILKNENYPIETIPGAAQRLFPILAGLIHKKVGKIRTNTGSVVQVANIGFDMLEGDKRADTIYLTNDTKLTPPIPVTGLNLKTKEIDDLFDVDESVKKELKRFRELSLLDNPTETDLNEMKDLKAKLQNTNVYYFTIDNKLVASLKPTINVGDVTYKGTMKINSAKVMMPFASLQHKLNMTWSEFQKAIEISKPLWEAGKNDQAPIDQRLFKNIISYRIPNQSISSNDTLEIVGILPPYAGDQAVVYHEITKKTGSDFDVDKLYLMLPSFDLVTNKTMTHHLFSKYVKKSGDGNWMYKKAAKEIYEELQRINPDNNVSLKGLIKMLGEYANKIDGVIERHRVNRALEKDILDVLSVDNSDISSYLITDYKENRDLKPIRIGYSITGEKGAQNNLIEMMQTILQSPATYDDLMTPLDSDLVRDSMYEVLYENYLNDIDEQEQKEMGDSYNPSTSKKAIMLQREALILERNQYEEGSKEYNELDNEIKSIKYDKDLLEFNSFKKRQVSPMAQVSAVNMVKNRVNMLRAKKLVATMANHMSDIGMSQIQGTKYLLDLGIKAGDLSKIYVDEYDGYFSSYDYNKPGTKITNVVSYFMNAAVDAAKDPYIIDGNFNSYTAGAAMFLIRSGIAPKEVFKLLLDPTIKKISDLKQAQMEITRELDMKKAPGVDLSLTNESLEILSQKFIAWKNDNINKQLSLSEMMNAIKNVKDDANPNLSKELLVGFWNTLVEAGKELNLDISVSKSDSTGAGKNIAQFNSILIDLEKSSVSNIGKIDSDGNVRPLNKIYKEGIKHGVNPPTDYVRESDPRIDDFTFLGLMQNNSLYLTKSIAEGLFIEATEGYREMAKTISKVIGRPLEISEQDFKDISSYLYPFVMAQSNQKLYNIPENEINLKIAYAKKMLGAMKTNPNYNKTELIKLMNINPISGNIEFAPGKKMNNSDVSKIREQLSKMYLSSDINAINFATSMIEYAFLTTGFRPKIGSFNHILPRTYFIERGHYNSVQNILNMLKNPNEVNRWNRIAEQAMVMHVSNNPRDYKYVISLNKSDVAIEDGKPITDKKLKEKLEKKDSFLPFVFKAEYDPTIQNSIKKLYMFGGTKDANPIYNEIKLSGFDNSGIEKVEKVFNVNMFKNNNFFITKQENYENYNLVSMTEAFSNANEMANQRFTYAPPLTKMLNMDIITVANSYNKIVSLVSDLLGNEAAEKFRILLLDELKLKYGTDVILK